MVMPRSATSSATVLVRPAMPCLAATYADLNGLATSACAEAMLMMRPHPRAHLGRRLVDRRGIRAVGGAWAVRLFRTCLRQPVFALRGSGDARRAVGQSEAGRARLTACRDVRKLCRLLRAKLA